MITQVIHAFKTDFEVSDEDIASDPSYFGYVAHSGKWIIQQRTASTGAYRYAFGIIDYSTAWGNRAKVSPDPDALNYDYYYKIKFL